MKSRASKDFGASLRAWRVRRGWDQAALAEQLGVSRQTVSYWERGETGPFPAQLQRIQDLMGVEAPPLDTPAPEAVQAVMAEAERALLTWWRTYSLRLLRAATGLVNGTVALDNSDELEAEAVKRLMRAATAPPEAPPVSPTAAPSTSPSARAKRRGSGA